MDAALKALAEPRRREILRLVWLRELPATEIADHFADVTRPAISQHLRVLAEAGLVTVRKNGTRRLYRARPEGLEELRAFFEQLWDDSLARLKDSIREKTNATAAPITSRPASTIAPSRSRSLSAPDSEETPPNGSASSAPSVADPRHTSAARSCGRVGAAVSRKRAPRSVATIAPRE